MEITFTTKALGRAIVILWIAFAVIWQVSLLLAYPVNDGHLIRFSVMLVKPFFLGAMILNGFSWPRLVVGIIGPASAFFILVMGILQSADDSFGPVIAMSGAVVYILLSLAVAFSKPVGRLAN